jgi:hypothetical protein
LVSKQPNDSAGTEGAFRFIQSSEVEGSAVVLAFAFCALPTNPGCPILNAPLRLGWETTTAERRVPHPRDVFVFVARVGNSKLNPAPPLPLRLFLFLSPSVKSSPQKCRRDRTGRIRGCLSPARDRTDNRKLTTESLPTRDSHHSAGPRDALPCISQSVLFTMRILCRKNGRVTKKLATPPPVLVSL